VPLDSQIFGSVAAGSDGREVFASSAGGIFQVFDDGATGGAAGPPRSTSTTSRRRSPASVA
jgi:hypothetical protein